MEREILLSGIGGQGIQLCAKLLSMATMRSNLRVLMFGTYDAPMRGGETDATVVIGRGGLVTPPVIDHAWAAICMHPEGWERQVRMLRPGGIAIINTSLFDREISYEGAVVSLAATETAAEAGMPQASTMIAVGAFAAATGIVELAALLDSCDEALPPYRRQHADTNRRALSLGYSSAPQNICPAWPELETA